MIPSLNQHKRLRRRHVMLCCVMLYYVRLDESGLFMRNKKLPLKATTVISLSERQTIELDGNG